MFNNSVYTRKVGYCCKISDFIRQVPGSTSTNMTDDFRGFTQSFQAANIKQL
jgi:hypothetical protein